jgi:hypothetical protein
MIRELREADIEAYAALRRDALLEAPLAFAIEPDALRHDGHTVAEYHMALQLNVADRGTRD